MIDAAPISVVIASHGRPHDLLRCVTALGFQNHPSFEVIVVADGAGLSALSGHPGAGAIKSLRFDTENLARARNLGAATAAGTVLAFIDDDAVPEPTWLSHLAASFDASGAAAVVGAVRGRNGISFQSFAPWIDRHGFTRDPGPGEDPRQAPAPGFVPKLVGTNMAIRTATFRDLGGFDEAYRFYLEDADLALRIAAVGSQVVHAPDAQVHHGFAASPRRTSERCPRSLHDNGRSLAIYLRKHGDPDELMRVVDSVRQDERRRALTHVVRGSCEPDAVPRLLADFDRGLAEGMACPISCHPPAGTAGDFRPFPGLSPGAEVHLLAGWPWQRAALSARAAELAGAGHIATLVTLGPTAVYHRVGFDSDGFWFQTGGIFGRAERHEPLFQIAAFASRVQREWLRVKPLRSVPAATFQTQLRWIRHHLEGETPGVP
ncbi:glycosyltransferase family 2 protein [Palleronia sp. KMU-117]|uniref:glycosyltransferase family 2 protein n=1 Tax=Palleronia sp. KMU-117 TaxID=3434108 RepID=UPI003D7373FE